MNKEQGMNIDQGTRNVEHRSKETKFQNFD